MCGLSGYYKSSKLDNSYIKPMAEVLSHRGPDNTGFYEDEIICLAHNRLSILDLSEKANQPFYSSNNKLVMIYNGEVYNYKEIAKELKFETRTNSDTEVVIEAYLKWGDTFVDKLNGMFAIAIYDREKKTLKLWRDRFGIKPLYYYWDGQHFAFASELKALHILPFQKEINQTSLGDYLFLEYIPQPNTILKNFFKLGNGQLLEFNGNNPEISTYYNLLDKVGNNVEINESIALEKFEELFKKSLKYRQISDVPIGAFLSGGIDSTSICYTLSSLNSNLKTFNIGFEDENFDESQFAEQAASLLNTDHSAYHLGADDLLSSLDKVLSQCDEPFAVSSIFPTYKVSELAKQNITVALSGDGGDELFMGYGHYTWYNRLKYLDNSIGKRIRFGSSNILKILPSKYSRVWQLLRYDTISKDWPHIWSQEQYMFSASEINRLTGLPNYNCSLNDSWKEINSKVDDVNLCISIFDLKHYLADDLLYKVDIASMAHSLEVRLPFLDHHLVEFAINLPTAMKIKSNQQKYLLKKYLENKFSKEFTRRKKQGFGTPINKWLNNELKDLTSSYLNPEKLAQDGIFNAPYVKEILNDFYSGKEYLNKRIWALLVFQIWKDKFLN